MQSPFHGVSGWLTRPALHIPAIAFLLVSSVSVGLLPQARAQTDQEGVEVLTRGPVHEAFAATITFKATEILISPQPPPQDIQEIPPEQRPEGDNVTWIPGYWAWDDENNGFLWVSGIWRNLPPGRQWIPGYWWESQDGYQWISGYWADAEIEEVEYLSAPPASLEAGPNIAAPSRNHSWIPGTWRWTESRYAWQPGYWYEAQPNWVWVPPYYTWAPQGWLFVDGYYDYDVPHRGLVFAPVRFSSGYSSRPDAYYRPTTVISLAVFTNHLFLRPRNRHYYFGDYYAPEYRRSGYFASFNYASSGYGYDPIYSHQRWSHRDDDRWERRHRDDFNYYRDNKSARPPRTFAAMGDFLSRPDRDRRVQSDYAMRLDRLAENRDSPVRLRKLRDEEKKSYARRGQEIREFSDQRRKLSRRGDDSGTAGRRDKDKDDNRKPGEGKSVKAKMPKSPVMARVAEGSNRPPSRPNAPDDRERSKKPNERERTEKKNDREKSGEKSDRDAGRDGRADRGDSTGRRTPKATQDPDSRAEPVDDARRRGRGQEDKPKPNARRDQPPAKEPNDATRDRSKAGGSKTGSREVKPNQDTEPRSREESRQSGRKSEPASPPDRSAREKKDPRPQAEPGRADSSPAVKAKPTSEPRGERKRESKPEPQREARADPKRKAQPAPRAESKRESKAESRRGSASADSKKPQPKATPRPQSKPPAAAQEKSKKKGAKPEDKEKKKGDDD